MPSLGLGLAQGRQLWEQERKTAEDNERYLATRTLYDMEIEDKTKEMATTVKENAKLRVGKEALIANSDAMMRGDPRGYINFLNTTNSDANTSWVLGKNKDGAPIAQLKDDKGNIISQRDALVGGMAIEAAQRETNPFIAQGEYYRGIAATQARNSFELRKMAEEYRLKGQIEQAKQALANAGAANVAAIAANAQARQAEIAGQYSLKREGIEQRAANYREHLKNYGAIEAVRVKGLADLTVQQEDTKGKVDAAIAQGISNENVKRIEMEGSAKRESISNLGKENKERAELRDKAITEYVFGVNTVPGEDSITPETQALLDEAAQVYDSAADIAARSGVNPVYAGQTALANKRNMEAAGMAEVVKGIESIPGLAPTRFNINPFANANEAMLEWEGKAPVPDLSVIETPYDNPADVYIRGMYGTIGSGVVPYGASR